MEVSKEEITKWRETYCQRIVNFIENFKRRGDKEKIEELFLNGCCYWFASILNERFSGDIYYDIVENHFLYYDEFTDCIYDIRGNLGKAKDTIYQNLVRWDTYDDESHRYRIVQHCIKLES